jgi:hypothetical protein
MICQVCQEARLALVPDWPCPYCREETGDDDGRRQHAGAWALGRRPADGKLATHMIWPDCTRDKLMPKRPASPKTFTEIDQL